MRWSDWLMTQQDRESVSVGELQRRHDNHLKGKCEGCGRTLGALSGRCSTCEPL